MRRFVRSVQSAHTSQVYSAACIEARADRWKPPVPKDVVLPTRNLGFYRLDGSDPVGELVTTDWLSLIQARQSVVYQRGFVSTVAYTARGNHESLFVECPNCGYEPDPFAGLGNNDDMGDNPKNYVETIGSAAQW